MIPRLILLAALPAAFAIGNPLTITLTGTGSGKLGSTFFNSASFVFTLTTDTTLLTKPPCCFTVDTPAGTPATFSIAGAGSGTLTDNQVVFVDPNTDAIGLAHFNDGDLFDLDDRAFAGYKLDMSLGPVTGPPAFVNSDVTLMTSAGTLNFTSISTVTFNAVVSAAPPAPTITALNVPVSNATHVSPGTPIYISGTNLGISATDLATISIGGKPAPVTSFTSSTSLVSQVPVDTPIGTTTATATYKGQTSAPFYVIVDAFSPTILVSVFDSAGNPISPSHVAAPNSQVYVIALGLGPTNPPMVTGVKPTVAGVTTTPVQVTVGGKPVTPDFAGLLLNAVGSYQVTFKVPADAPVGALPVFLTVGGQQSNTVTLQVGPPVTAIGGVVSASAFGGFSTVAPASWVEIYGSNLAPHTRQWAGPDFTGNNAPTMLDGVQVVIAGQKAFVDFISTGQVNAQLPSNIGVGPTQIVLTNGSAASAPFNITVNTTQPGLLAPPSFKIGANQYVVAQFSDGTYVLPAGAIPGVNSRPAAPGETIVIYGIGFGSVTPNIPAGQIVTQANQLSLPLQILFGNTPARTPYFGLAPNFVGLYQFNVVVPAVSNNDLVPLTFNLGGVPGTQTLFIAVRQ
ncbi:MAG: IPT/TIG domain-containing protein [Acidobacteriota bacterium]|nr:IPT/TIG domain-containing protein [Acidobacteriota bacterium]